VFILDSLLIGGLRFVLDKVVAAAEAEMNDDTALRDQLLEAQMRLELATHLQLEQLLFDDRVVVQFLIGQLLNLPEYELETVDRRQE